MLYLPPFRRLLYPLLLCLAILIIFRRIRRSPASYLYALVPEQPVIQLPDPTLRTSNLSTHALIAQRPTTGEYFEPPTRFYFEYGEERNASRESESNLDEGIELQGPRYTDPAHNVYILPLLQCPVSPNQYTNHIRISATLRDISLVLAGENENEKRSYFNAAILSLPWWSENQYLLVARAQTDGSVQMNMICEANICYTNESLARPGEKPCDPEDLNLLRGAEGLRCATPPLTLDVPPTPALSCGDIGPLVDLPGFHDPRILWSGKGEPIMIVNSQSRYACFGLWAIDLRLLYRSLRPLLGSNPQLPGLGPLMSYPSLTEITRNPPHTRGFIEKNWMFFSNPKSSYIHYDLGPSVRSFAKLLGNGLTTANLTDPLEQPCLQEGAPVKKGQNWGASWHQGTNSLRLILCERGDMSCRAKPENTVFWAVIHHKHKSAFGVPLRYERYVIVWASTPPFSMLAMSSHPILLANETANGWEAEENWEGVPEAAGRGHFAGFTYTVSIAWAWGRPLDRPEDKNTGYLDDEVIMGLGVDDVNLVYARVKAQDLLQCLRVCPPRAAQPLDGSGDAESRKKKVGDAGNVFNEEKFGGNEDVDAMLGEAASPSGEGAEAAGSAATGDEAKENAPEDASSEQKEAVSEGIGDGLKEVVPDATGEEQTEAVVDSSAGTQEDVVTPHPGQPAA